MSCVVEKSGLGGTDSLQRHVVLSFGGLEVGVWKGRGMGGDGMGVLGVGQEGVQ